MSKSRVRRQAWRHASLSFLCAALAGCSFVPTYRRPEVSLPAHWSAEAPVSPQTSTTTTRWWEQFGSTELNDLVGRGLRDSFDLRMAVHRIEQARGRAEIAGAGRYPTLDVGLNGTRGSGGSSGSTQKRQATLQGAFTPDLWGLQRALADSADATAHSSRLDAAVVREALIASIASTYFQIVALQERAQVAQLIADDAQKTLSLIQTQTRLGAASQLEVAQQVNAVATFRAAVPLLRQQKSQAIGDLAVLVGMQPEELSLQLMRLQDVKVPDVLAQAPSDVIARLPEVQTAEAQLQAANFDIGAARAAFLPTLSLTASYGSTLNPSQAVWSLAGAALQPLLDGGQRSGQLRVDRAHAQELVVGYRKAIAAALQQVEAQMSAAGATRDAEALDQDAVSSARKALELARIRQTSGATDFLTVLLSQRALYQAEDAALQIRLQRLQATVGLYRALGTGLDSQATRVAAATPSNRP